MIFFILIARNKDVDKIIFFNFANVSNLDWKFYVFKNNFIAKSLSPFVILAVLRSAGFKYETIPYL